MCHSITTCLNEGVPFGIKGNGPFGYLNHALTPYVFKFCCCNKIIIIYVSDWLIAIMSFSFFIITNVLAIALSVSPMHKTNI
jgi:hypothetical protein